VRTRRRQSVQTMRRLIALLLFLASAAIHAEAFRLTTWNLDFRPQESAWSADGERVARIASVLSSLDADVIVLQAVPDRQTCEALAALLAPSRYQVATCSTFAEITNLSQVAILSRRPVVLAWTEPWKAEGAMAPTGGLAGAAVRVGAEVVVVFSVQIENNVASGDSERDIQINILEREFAASQLAEQARSIDSRLTNHAAAVIIAGSLNTNPDEPQFVSENTVRLLEEAGFQNAFNGTRFRDRITRPADGEVADATCDYVLARGAKFPGKAAILTSNLSGHLPVTCDLVVPSPDPILENRTPRRIGPLWLAPLIAAPLLLLVWWRIGSRRRYYSPARLGDFPGDGHLALPDEAEHGFAELTEPAQSLPPNQDPALDSTDTQIEFLRSRADAAEQRATRAVEVVRQGLVPHLARLMKDVLFRRVVSQRAQLVQMQQAGALRVAEIEQRLAAIQTQLQSRLSAYEQRIAELEEEVSAKDQANRELLAAQMQMMKQVLETSPAVEEETQKT